MSTTHEQGICPICGSDNLDYQPLEIGDGDYVYYPCTCNECGATFNEVYSLEFDKYYDIQK